MKQHTKEKGGNPKIKINLQSLLSLLLTNNMDKNHEITNNMKKISIFGPINGYSHGQAIFSPKGMKYEVNQTWWKDISL